MASILTFTRKVVTPTDMQPWMFDIRDVAHSLANAQRYVGHCVGFCSIAEHSVRVSQLVPSGWAKEGLLHELDEPYLPDMPTDVKYLPEMEWYRTKGKQIVERGAKVFNLKYPFDSCVKKADTEDLEYKNEFIRFCDAGLPPKEAERQFLDRYFELTR